MVDFT
jgi:calcium/calmodulin-dependent protein kinase I